MGYELHITRKLQWFDDEGPEVTLEDWLAYVKSDPEMRLDGFAEAVVGGGDVLRVEDESLAVWTAYSRDGEGGNHAWFAHFTDCVSVKNPDAEIIGKMSRIAEVLGAVVMGDDGELYGSDGEVLPDPEAQSEATAAKPWWKFW
ncbi:MAG: hypothetical protein ACK4RV_02575 [Caulobacter sp.]